MVWKKKIKYNTKLNNVIFNYMDIDKLIKELEIAYGCLVGSHTHNYTPQQQFRRIIDDIRLNGVKRMDKIDKQIAVEENYRFDCGIKYNYKFTGDENYLISKIVESQLQQNKPKLKDFSLTALEISKEILYKPVTNGQAEQSIIEGALLIDNFAKEYQQNKEEESKLPRLELNVLICPNCGIHNPIHLINCNNCGSKLTLTN